MNKPRIRRYIGACILSVVLLPSGVAAASFSDSERHLNDTASEARSLAGEIKALDAEITTKSAYIQDLDAKVATAKSRLSAVNADLVSLELDQQAARAVFLRYLRSAYVHRGHGVLTTLLGEGSVSEAMADEAYLGSLQDYSSRVVARLNAVESRLNKRQQDALNAYRELDNLQAQSEQQNIALAGIRSAKQQLLARTEGQEELFRQQFEGAKGELKKTGQFARRARDRVQSRVWRDDGFYFNQLDKRWIDTKLGFSDSSTLGDYGCGVAALAMVYKYYGMETDPPKLNESLRQVRAFVDDLMDWRNATLPSSGRLKLAHEPYPLGKDRVDWGLINRQLDSGNPVIVYVARGTEISHYVLLISRQGGGYVMHDPIEGPNLRFDRYYQTGSVYQFITFQRA